MALALGSTSRASVMLLILVLLGTLGVSAGSLATLACITVGVALLSRLIMPMLIGMVRILIQTVVVLLSLLLILLLATILSRRAVLRAPEVAGSRRLIAFVFAVHW